MWIYDKISGLLAALPSTVTIYLLCISLGLGVGGYSVHKLYELKELSVLKKQAAQHAVERDARFASALQATQLAREASQQIAATKREVFSHVPRAPACRLNRDTVRLLNQLRGTWGITSRLVAAICLDASRAIWVAWRALAKRASRSTSC